MSIITLMTDFGTDDWFTGTMKGVILRIAPRATVVDLTHGIPRGDIRAGAYALAASYSYFPRGTIHVVVVDPGVGSGRAAVLVRTASYCFVGPDNGVLSLALAGQRIKTIRRLENERYFLPSVSRMFHGRDVFAPVAAHVSKGVADHVLGPVQHDFVRLRWPRVSQRGGSIHGEVVYVDRFGNAMTNIDSVSCTPQAGARVLLRGTAAVPVGLFYEAVPARRPVAVPGSLGFLEIAVNGGSAAERLGLRVGSPVVVQRRKPKR